MFQRAYDRDRSHYLFLFKVQGYYKSIRDKGRKVSMLKQTLGRTGPLPENVTASIASFLSGKPGTLNMQTAALKQNAGIQGGRRTRRRQVNKSRKSRKPRKTRGRK